MRKLRNEHQQEMIFIQAKLAAKNEDNFQWKKEGNRRQFEVMQKIVEKALQSIALYQAANQTAGESTLKEVVTSAQERIKLLKIADSSPHGWGTVAEYEANPITQGEEDDKKLKKAEKAAQEKSALRLQERNAKQARFSNFNRGGYQGQSFRSPGYQFDNRSPSTYGYRAFGGFKSNNPFRQPTVTPEKPLPKRNVNNDLCYACGRRGHWANACPELKKGEQEDTKQCKYIYYYEALNIGSLILAFSIPNHTDYKKSGGNLKHFSL